MIIKGNKNIDQRGSISFINDFDMSRVKRFYTIEPKPGVVRAWQGHELENKWFHVVNGRFLIKLRALESGELLGDYELSDELPQVLCIPGGIYNGFEALEEESKLMVFSDATLEQSQQDDYRLSLKEVPWH